MSNTCCTLRGRISVCEKLLHCAGGNFHARKAPALCRDKFSPAKSSCTVQEEISTGEKLLHVAVTIRIIFYTKLGNRSEKINNAMPQINTTTVRRLTPFHSFSTMPQILLKKTFSDIRMLHEKASITGESVK